MNMILLAVRVWTYPTRHSRHSRSSADHRALQPYDFALQTQETTYSRKVDESPGHFFSRGPEHQAGFVHVRRISMAQTM